MMMKKKLIFAALLAVHNTLLVGDLFSQGSLDFTGSPTSGPAALRVQFTAIVNLPGEIVSVFWNFGDGDTSTDLNPSNTYVSAGSYTVRLTVVTTAGRGEVVKFNYITVTAPIAQITLTSPNGGQNWQVGSIQNIIWTSNNLSGNVEIELSRNDETFFPETIAFSAPNNGSYS